MMLSFGDLVTFLLHRFRLDDSVDLQDLIGIRLLDETWLARLPTPLATRLKELLDHPEWDPWSQLDDESD